MPVQAGPSKMSLPASNGKTLLITGINGYIASVLGLHVLSKGYSLRGTTRRRASAEPLLSGPYALYRERISIYEVPDMTVKGAFDEAAYGVDGIFHTASPIDFNLETYEQTIITAEKGSEILLESALKSGPRLSSVVVTSSVAAVIDPQNEHEHVYTEADFASVSLERAKKDREEGVKTPPGVLYGASKIAAERAVWRFRDAFKPSFAITTVNPSVVLGPPILLPSTASSLNETIKPIFTLISGSSNAVPSNIGSASFVDVRDVAVIHLWAFENAERANGERYIACAGFGPMQSAADLLREMGWRGVPAGVPGEGYVGFDKETGKVVGVEYPVGNSRPSGAKVERVMGVVYKEFRESVLDTAEVLRALL